MVICVKSLRVALDGLVEPLRFEMCVAHLALALSHLPGESLLGQADQVDILACFVLTENTQCQAVHTLALHWAVYCVVLVPGAVVVRRYPLRLVCGGCGGGHGRDGRRCDCVANGRKLSYKMRSQSLLLCDLLVHHRTAADSRVPLLLDNCWSVLDISFENRAKSSRTSLVAAEFSFI